jgi:Putative metallopeptidase
MSRMRPPRCPPAVLVGLALVTSAVLATPVAAQTWESIPANPRVEIEYVAPTSAQLESVYKSLKQRKILEELQHFLAPLHLPHPLRLLTRQCDEVNAFYSGSSRSLTICYELVAEIMDSAPRTVSADGFITRQAAIVGNLLGVVLHEGGHMLFDMLDVPVFGREEDAADQTASFIALQFNKDVARTIVKGFVYFWARQQDPAASAPMSVWSDVHGKASQRMYNALCLAYGGDPQTFQEFVNQGWLPKKRAEHCDQEFAQLKLAFVNTVLPFIDQDLMARVQQTQWLTADELK